MTNKTVDIKHFQNAMMLLHHVGFGYTKFPLPIEDLCIFQNITDIVECLCNDVWGFDLQHSSSINGRGRYLLRKNVDTDREVVCRIKTNKENIELEFFTRDEFIKLLIEEGKRL